MIILYWFKNYFDTFLLRSHKLTIKSNIKKEVFEMTEQLKDETIVCKDCGKEFVFTVGEQQFYAEKGFQNKPVRCKECRIAKKQASEKRN